MLLCYRQISVATMLRCCTEWKEFLSRSFGHGTVPFNYHEWFEMSNAVDLRGPRRLLGATIIRNRIDASLLE